MSDTMQAEIKKQGSKWPMVKLGDIVDIKGGGTPSKDMPEYWGGDIPWVSVKDFKSSLIDIASDYITAQGLEKSATNLIPRDTIVVPTRMAVGKVALLGADMAINQDLKALIIKNDEKVDKRFLLRFLESSANQILKFAKGATVKGITLDVLKDLDVPLPPLEEQKRIAAILDKADAIRRKRQQAIDLADEFLRSVFLDMFGDPVTNPKGWNVVPLIELCNKVTDGTHQSPKWEESGIPFLFISNIVNGKISFDTNKFISKVTLDELTRSAPIEQGDILYTTVGSYGNVARVTDDTEFCFQRHIAHIKPNHEIVNAEFLTSMLSSSVVRRQADRLVRGIAQKTLNLRELKGILVFDVSLEEQKNYLKIVGPIHKIKNNYGNSVNELLNNFNSLSQKAFSGEL